MTNNIKTDNILATMIINNDTDFAKVYVNANKFENKQDFKAYVKMVEQMHNAFYQYKANATAENKQKAYDSLKTFLHCLGKINGAYITTDYKINDDCDTTLFVDIYKFSWQYSNIDIAIDIVNKKSERKTMQKDKQQAKNDNDFAKYKAIEQAIKNINKDIKALEQTAKQQTTIVNQTSLNHFKKGLEKTIAKAITKQKAKSLEQILQEKQARNEQRKQQRKQAKASKKASQQKVDNK